MKDIAILTFQSSNNYGALLQCYALSRTLRDNNYKVSILNLRKEYIKEVKKMPFLLRNKFLIKQKFLNFLFQRTFDDFRQKHFKKMLTKAISQKEELERFKDSFDAVIVGSDQVWRGAYTKELQTSFFLDFVSSDTKKISYAASFGVDYFEGYMDNQEEIFKLVQKFNSVSVRESDGVSICNSTFGIDAVHVLDPVFLLKENNYQELISEEDDSKDKTYLAYYFLNPDDFRASVISKVLAQKKNIHEQKNIYTNEKFSFKKPSFPLTKYRFRTFSSFLATIKNAEFIVTDSFHGLAFSIIFNKQFVCIANSKRGASRMKSVLKILGLSDRLIKEGDNHFDFSSLTNIDYERVNKALQLQRDVSKSFLLNALEE